MIEGRRVQDAYAPMTGCCELPVPECGESSSDGLTRGADELADLLLRQMHLGSDECAGLLFCRELGEEARNSARGVVGAELDAAPVGLAKTADQHPSELDSCVRVLGDEGPKFVGGQHLGGQRLQRHRAGGSGARIERGELADYLARPTHAEDRLVALLGCDDDLDPAFDADDHEVARVPFTRRARCPTVHSLRNSRAKCTDAGSCTRG